MRWLWSFGLMLACVVAPALADNNSLPSPSLPRDAFVNALLAKMTIEEKIGQLRLISVGPDNPKEAIREMIQRGQVGGIFNTVTRPDIRVMQDQAMQLSRLKIPLFFAYDIVHGQRTIFPISLGLASSWDLQAVATSGRIAAFEASEDGLNMTWAPMVDITRDPRWGRVSEGLGEDTFLTQEIGRTLVSAIQGKHPGDRHSLMTSVKHFALYGAVEGGRDYNTVDMSPQKMFQDYLPPYKAALDAGSGGVMVALNSINGTPATVDRWLLQDVLRKAWHFTGITVSDHGAIKELIKHGVAADPEQAAKMAINAGINMSMSDEYFLKYLPGLIQRGEVSQATLDDAVRHVLNVKYDMGLFRDPYVHLGPAGSDPADTNAESRLHRAEARQVAREGLVLLKNRLNTLPLKKQGTLAVIGPLADSKRDIMGSWSAAGRADQSVTLLEGIRHAVGDKAKVLYARGANITDHQDLIAYLNQYEQTVKVDPRTPQAMIDDAVRTARQADVVIAAVGEAQGMAHEASSRSDITIPESQRRLLRALKATGKPLVVVLLNGRPLALLLTSGRLDELSLMKEYANRAQVFHQALGEHLTLLFGTLAPALLIGIPLGFVCHRSARWRPSLFAVLNIIQTLPAIALFGLLIAPLSGLAAAWPWLREWGIGGIGLAPALIALVLYALLPLVRSVHAGLAQVPDSVVDAARGMGLSRRQLFWRVEVPLALPVMLSGVRVIAVQTVGMGMVAALIGAGGFGALMFQGLLSSALELVLLGVIPAIALALLVDTLFKVIISMLQKVRL